MGFGQDPTRRKNYESVILFIELAEARTARIWGCSVRLKLAGIVIAASSFAALQSAFATDLPVNRPAYKAPMAAGVPWTGFYLSGGAGYGIWAADETVLAAAGVCVVCETQVQGGKGWLGTIGAGYDYRFTPRIVAGLFGDASISSLKGTIQDIANGASGDIKETSFWAVGARGGWLVNPKTLTYWNAGYTAGRFSSTNLVTTANGAATALSTPSFTASGWFLGGGLEISLSPSWFWRTEYRYAYYNSKTIAELPTGNGITFEPTVQTVTTQIVYKFNGRLPAAPYPGAPKIATNWTGFYANAGGGYGIWAADSTLNTVGTSSCISCTKQVQGGKGYLGLVGGGYDWQFSPAWVAGVFGDFAISSVKGTIQDIGNGVSGSIKETSSWAVGPRLGWLASPQTMTYINGGYTGAQFSGENLVLLGGGSSSVTTPEFTASGWFVGGGVETTFDLFGMLGNGWFWRSEYRYSSYGNRSVTDFVGGAPLNDITFKPVVQTVTSSVIFKFN
jgi:outer membrane immunogenic protein